MTQARMQKDFSRSGITPAQIKQLKISVLTKQQTTNLSHLPAASYKIPYFNTNGKPTKYYRVRYLEAAQGAFGEVLTKAPRYSGPADTPPHAYFPPVINWRAVEKDAEQTIVITEGEKKAAAGCFAGGNVIGLGGVAMYQARKRGFDLLPELDAFKLSGRAVIIAFDSDKQDNPDIIREQNTLAKRYLERDAHVYICDIPEVNDWGKTGLDDYLAAFAARERSAALEALLAAALDNEYEGSAELWALQSEVAYIEGHGSYYHFRQAALVKNAVFLENGAFANRFYNEPCPTEANPGKTKTVNAFKAWREWSQRRTHTDITYEPAEPEITEKGAYNVWPGWGVDSKKGDLRPFVKLVDYLLAGDSTLKKWFWQWLAYPIQNPGAKLYSAVVMHGPTQGTGKTFLGEIIGDIYGENFSLLTQDDLEDKFNDAFARRQFCLADEVVATGRDARKHADKLKGLITRQSITVNKKFETKYRLRDTVNYLFTSNHFDAIYIERGDRRYAVCQVPEAPLTRLFYAKLRAWRGPVGGRIGARHLMYHLQHKVNCDGFSPTANPPASAAHADMVQTSFSDIDAWCEDLKTNPELALSLGGAISAKVMFKPSEALAIYDPIGRRGTSGNALGRGLKKAGFRQRIARTKKGPLRLWALRDRKIWNARSSGEWGQQWDIQNEKSIRGKVT